MQKTEEFELLKFHNKMFARILLIEFHLRRAVSKLRPDAYAAACSEHEAPMLGDLIRLIETEQLQEVIMPAFAMDLRSYNPQNRFRKRGGGAIVHAYRFRRISLALWLFRNIRNGVCHGNDLLAMRLVNGQLRPRIFTQIIVKSSMGALRLNASVLPENIERFVDDFAATLVCATPRADKIAPQRQALRTPSKMASAQRS